MKVAPPPPQAAGTQADAVANAAKQLEAFFLRQLLKEARPAGGGSLDGGFAGDTFKQMMDEALADKMSAAGGIGMSTMFEKQLGAAAGTPEVAFPGAGVGVAGARGVIGLRSIPDANVLGPTIAGAPPFALPVAGRGTSGYGMRTDPIHGTKSMHPGVDVAAPTGTPVGAASAGEVVHAGPAGTYGNLVTVRHADGFETRYAHLSQVSVAKGDQVTAGQLVGQVGSTGRSTGPHLHFEIRKDGKHLDPTPYLPLNGRPDRATR